jgi:phosphoglycolate phosphatase
MKKFNPKLIMIDVDGTLVDSVPDLAYCVDELMVTMGREKWGEAQVRHWVGNGVPKLRYFNAKDNNNWFYWRR